MTGITPVSIGALVESGSPAFGHATTAGNLLVAWVGTNSSSSTFDTTCNNSNWVSAGHAGAGFNWASVWYRQNCGASEAAPTFSSGGSDLWSQLGEFAGAATSSVFDQTGASAQRGDWGATLPNPDAVGGELITAAGYWNGSNPGGTIGVAIAGNQQPQFIDSNGGTITGTLAYAGNANGQYAASIFGVAGFPGSVPHTVRLAPTVFVNGYGVIASFKPASPLTAALTAATFSLPGRFTGIPYSANVAVTGGAPQYTWSVTVGSLPTGLSLSTSTGAITGTPTVAGTYNFTVQVTDSAAASVSMPLSIVITVSPAVLFTTTYPPTQNASYPTSPTADPEFTGVGPSDQTKVYSNVWGPIAGCSQTTNVQSAHQWYITASFNDPAGAVHTFPDTGAQNPLSPTVNWRALSYLATGWDVYMDPDSDIVASACYDLFFDKPLVGQTGGAPGSAEVMAHFSLRNRGGGPYFATNVKFGGYNAGGFNIPATTWSLAWAPGFGAAFWNIGSPADTYASMDVGAIDWVPMLQWLVDANILPYGANIRGFSVGFEVCSTNGNTNTFVYNDAWWHGLTANPGPPLRPSIINRAVTIGTRIG